MAINVALLGAGSIGAIHARNLQAHPAFQLGFVADSDPARAEALSEECGGVALSSAEEAVSGDGVDAVIVASSTVAHRDHVLLGAQYRRALLCEKPVADSLADAMECASAVADAGIVAAMGFNRRLDRAYHGLFQAARNGDVGDIESLRLVSRSDSPPAPESVPLSGGMLREKGAHFYDLACWLADSEPVEVSAMGGCLIDPRFGDFDDVDTAIITLRFESGALAGFDFGRRTVYGCDEMIELFGSGGLAVAERQPVAGMSRLAGSGWSSPGPDASWRQRFAETYVLELDAFAAAIAGKYSVHASLQDGLRAQAVAEAAIDSMKRATVVPVEAVWI